MIKMNIPAFLTMMLVSIWIQAQPVKIAAAANLRLALDEIKTAYLKANPETGIEINYGASGNLTQQIMNGAVFDLFMAADKTFPDKLKEQGFVSGEVKTYAYGKLVLWSNSLDVSKGLSVLTGKSVKRIAVAKPELAPYGNRAVESLKFYRLFDQLKTKIVYADNIAQAAQFAQTGNAEVGILAFSLTKAPEMKGSFFELDSKSYHPVEQAMVLVKGSEKNLQAIRFMNYILSSTCKPIFEKYGYKVP